MKALPDGSGVGWGGEERKAEEEWRWSTCKSERGVELETAI
jgi:hypothetical protein